MVSKKPDGQIYFKMTYWGPSQGGKTTSVDSLYKLLRSEQSRITPVSEFQKISMQSQSTLFFDRGVFRAGGNVFFRTYTVAGQKRFTPLRKVVFSGSDGVIFVVDSRKSQWYQNVDALEELVALTRSSGKLLVKNYPFIVMLNKRDLPSITDRDQIIELLENFGLIYPTNHKLALWNPLIYDTIATEGVNVTRAFAECARRIIIYYTQGNGSAPIF